jgi:hypothetical protein
MNDEQRIAHINSRITCAQIRALGMQAENTQLAYFERPPQYAEKDFEGLIQEYGIDHNSVIGYLTGR